MWKCDKCGNVKMRGTPVGTAGQTGTKGIYFDPTVGMLFSILASHSCTASLYATQTNS